MLEARLTPAGPVITAVNPLANSHTAATSANIQATFDQPLNAATVTDQTFVVHGQQTGRLETADGDSFTASGAVVTVNPAANFHPGEVVQVTATSGIKNGGGEGAARRVWEFRTAATGYHGVFLDSGQALVNTTTESVALGDVDGDGDLDVVVGNIGANRVLLNNGGGVFSDSGQALGNKATLSVALGDVDGDGDLDLVQGNYQDNSRVWLNNGSGTFSLFQTLPSPHATYSVALGDVDGDGDLDLVQGNFNQPTHVWVNNGGIFSDSGQALGGHATRSVALGDVDGDGDLDLVQGNQNQANRVWLNSGGVFTDSGQALGSHNTFSVALGDLDGDGDLDFVDGNLNQASRVWLNNGGVFSDSLQALGDHATRAVALGDVDGDGDLDLVQGNDGQGNRVWLNTGSGVFTDSGQALGNQYTRSVALGDLDGDGDLDLVQGNFNQANRVWVNQNAPADLALTKVSGGVAVRQGGTLTYTITVTNNGPEAVTGARVTDTFSDLLTGVSWTAAFTNGSGTTIGSGDIDQLIDLDDGGTVVYTVTATVVSAGTADLSAQSIVSNFARVTVPATMLDPNAANNQDADADVVVLRASTPTPGLFRDSGQALGDHATRSVALGDVDGDGDLDLIEGNYNQATRVWVNNGSGAFSDSGQALGNHATASVALGDVDGDGDLDLVQGNFFQATRVWMNNGSGVFTDSGQALGNQYTRSVALGDVDGDGDLDIVQGNSQQPTRVWVNNGSGVFSNSGQALGFHRAYSVALGDVDSDGDLDFIQGNLGQPTRVWRNNGSGVFTDSGQTLGNHNTNSVALGDVDGDGDLDFVEGNGFNQATRMWRNNGSGVFSDSGQALGDHNTNSVALGDVDGDGDLDFVEGNYGQATRVWRNDQADLALTKVNSGVAVLQGGTLTYTITVTNNGPDAVSGARVTDTFSDLLTGVAWTAVFTNGSGNLTGSGDLDQLINLNNGGMVVYTVTATVVNAGAPGLAAQSIVSNVAQVAVPAGVGDPNAANNQDADADVVVLRASTPTLGLFSELGNAVADHKTTSLALGDVDGDGDLDFVEGNYGQATRVWRNNGGVFSDSGQTLGNHNTTSVALGDLDGDGDLDIVQGNKGQATRVWWNNGSGVFNVSGQILGNHNTNSVALGDVDGDGDLDIVQGNANQVTWVWLNNGSGTFSDSGQALGDHATTSVALGDVDGDGDLDFVQGNDGQANRVWVNNGSGVFSDSGQSLGSHATTSVALGDVDGDGDLDLVQGNDGQANRVWLNNGIGTFSDSGQALGDHATTGVALGDVDGDGDLDFVEGNGFNEANRVWRNNGNGVFSDSDQALGSHATTSVALGDVDGDGDLDLVEGNYNQVTVVRKNQADVTSPAVSITDNKPGVANIASGDVEFTFTFTEAVFGFTASDVMVTGGTKGTFTGSDGDMEYKLVVTPETDSTADITVDVALGVASDSSTNPNTAATQAVQPVDTKAPSVTITDDEDNGPDVANIVGGDVIFTFTFSEPVFGFTASDVTVTGGTKGTFTGSDGDTVYTLAVTPLANSTADITVDVADGVAVDGASNPNTAATQAVQAVDTTGLLVATGNETGAGQVHVYYAGSGLEIVTFAAYADMGGYTGGARVALADVTGDGILDLITAPGKGMTTGGAEIRVYDGAALLAGTVPAAPLFSFRPYNTVTKTYTGEVYVAAADFNNDDKADIVTGNVPAKGPTVKIFDGANLTVDLLAGKVLKPFGSTYKGGVRVAVGDVNGDAKADVIVGQSKNGSKVIAYDGLQLLSGTPLNFKKVLVSKVVSPTVIKGGVFVAAGKLDADLRIDIIVGLGAGAKSNVFVYEDKSDTNTKATLLKKSTPIYGAAYKGGVRVAALDVTGDGIAEVLTTAGAGPNYHLLGLSAGDGLTLAALNMFFSQAPDFSEGRFLAGARSN